MTCSPAGHPCNTLLIFRPHAKGVTPHETHEGLLARTFASSPEDRMKPCRQRNSLHNSECALATRNNSAHKRMSVKKRNSRRAVALGLLAACLFGLVFGIAGCRKSSTQSGGNNVDVPKDALEVDFLYSSEKENWIRAVTGPFNGAGHKTASGRRIFIKATPMGSGELMDAVLSGQQHAHLLSPASAAFIKQANAQSRAKTGKDLLAKTDNLVLSPVVIAMWKPMAQAIGWGKKPIGWSDVLALARDRKGWQTYGFPQWGQFKFGHTHPEYSNSGLISVLAEVYAAAGKKAGLTSDDLAKPAIGQYVSDIESSVVHYGTST